MVHLGNGNFQITVELPNSKQGDYIFIQSTVTQPNPDPLSQAGSAIADGHAMVEQHTDGAAVPVTAEPRAGTPPFVSGRGIVTITQASDVWTSVLVPGATTFVPGDTWALPAPPATTTPTATQGDPTSS